MPQKWTLEIFQGARLFQRARLLFLPSFPGGTFIPEGTFIPYSRVTLKIYKILNSKKSILISCINITTLKVDHHNYYKIGFSLKNEAQIHGILIIIQAIPNLPDII